MMKSKSAQKIKLTSYDDLFGTNEQPSSEVVTFVPINLLHAFKDHPFRVVDDEKMQETVESVKKYGILMPGIVRPHPENGYEVIAGHRRWRACELAGLDEMPVIVRDLDDDAATVIMVDTNIQREDILPSEKAYAYKMKYEAIKHQGSKAEKIQQIWSVKQQVTVAGRFRDIYGLRNWFRNYLIMWMRKRFRWLSEKSCLI